MERNIRMTVMKKRMGCNKKMYHYYLRSVHSCIDLDKLFEDGIIKLKNIVQV